MPNEGERPILRIGAGDFTALVQVGEGLVCIHNEIVGVVRPVNPVKFRRGATNDEIRRAWEESQK